MTTTYTFECSNTISKPEAELAFKLGLQLITEYRSILVTPSDRATLEHEREALIRDVSLEREALIRETTLERESLEKVNAELKRFYESQLKSLEQRYETRLQQTHDQHNKALDAIKRQETNYVQEKLGEIAGLLKQNKTIVDKGIEGEHSLQTSSAHVFRDFPGFAIEDKHKQSGKGDYHLHFKDFSVLADSKNYTSNVPNTDRVKIKRDLEQNPHMEFAWLVSLNSGIDKYDKYPIMVEWANTKQCIVYINQLHSNPEWLLRSAWYLCDLLHKMNADHDGQTSENQVLKERMHKAFENVKSARTVVREVNSNINKFKDLMTSLDDRLKMVLEIETQAIVESGQAQMEAWWDANIRPGSPSDCLVSSKLWTKFKQDTRQIESKEQFQTFIKGKVDASMLKFHGKGANAAFDLHGIQWLQQEATINLVLK